jgi:hypothetical protein
LQGDILYHLGLQPTDALMHRFFNLSKGCLWMGDTPFFHAAEHFFTQGLPAAFH